MRPFPAIANTFYSGPITSVTWPWHGLWPGQSYIRSSTMQSVSFILFRLERCVHNITSACARRLRACPLHWLIVISDLVKCYYINFDVKKPALLTPTAINDSLHALDIRLTWFWTWFQKMAHFQQFRFSPDSTEHFSANRGSLCLQQRTH